MKRLWVSLLLVVSPVVLRADAEVWALTDGRSVTVLKVLSQNATHVTVRTADGILQVDKRQLPEDVSARYPYDELGAAVDQEVRAAQERRAAELAEQRAAQERARREKKPAAPATGVTILTVRAAGPAIAYVTVANHTAGMFEVNRDMFVGENVSGLRFPSLRFTNPRGDILTRVKIAPGKEAEIGVVFDIPAGEVPDIGKVFWRQR